MCFEDVMPHVSHWLMHLGNRKENEHFQESILSMNIWEKIHMYTLFEPSFREFYGGHLSSQDYKDASSQAHF